MPVGFFDCTHEYLPTLTRHFLHASDLVWRASINSAVYTSYNLGLTLRAATDGDWTHELLINKYSKTDGDYL